MIYRVKVLAGRCESMDHNYGDLLGEEAPAAKTQRERVDAAVLKEEGVNTVAIMSNDYATYTDDSPDKMMQFAARHGFGFPYLVDETQEVARAWGAVCTPDFFGLNAAGELQYRGRIDDAKMGDADGRTPELLNAMRQIAATGKGPAEQFPSMGCSVKWR